jgi:hypothetical protein
MNITFLNESILNIWYFLGWWRMLAAFCGIWPLVIVVKKAVYLTYSLWDFLLTPPAETCRAICTVAVRTVGRNCTHGCKTLSALSARFVIQNVWRSAHEICWSMSLQCEACAKLHLLHVATYSSAVQNSVFWGHVWVSALQRIEVPLSRRVKPSMKACLLKMKQLRSFAGRETLTQ